MFVFLQCVGEAVVAQGLRGLMGAVPFGEKIYDITNDTIERYRKAHRLNKLIADVEQVVQAQIEEIRIEAKQIAQEVAAGHTDEEIIQLELYLTQLPAVARQSLKRPHRSEWTLDPECDGHRHSRSACRDAASTHATIPTR